MAAPAPTRSSSRSDLAAPVRGPTALAAAILVAAIGVSCGIPDHEDGADGRRPPATVDTVTERPIEEVLAAYTEGWMELAGVEGTGIGECDDAPCIKVFVSRAPGTFARAIPAEVEGYPVKLEPTGKFEVR